MKYSYIQVIKRLDKLSGAFSSIRTQNELVKSVEEVLEDIFDVQYTGLYLFDPTEQRLKLFYAKGFNEEEKVAADLSSMDRHPGLIYRTKKMLYIADTLLDKQELTSSSERSFVVRSRLYLPVMNGEQVVGAFGIVDAKPNAFNEEDIAILSFICNMAGALYCNILNQNLLQSANEQILSLSKLPTESPNPVLRISQNNILLFANNAIKPILNYYGLKEGHEVSNDLMVPFTQLIKSGKSVEKEITDGKSIYSFIFTWVKGEEYVNLYGRDITRRKILENELKKNEAKHAKMVANISDVIVIINDKGINTYKSPNLENLFGWHPNELIGISAFENIHPEEREALAKIFDVILKDPDGTVTAEFRYLCKDGSYKWVHFTGVNLFHDPDIQGILGNYHDITASKKGEIDLLESEKRWKFALETATDGMWDWDIPNNSVFYSTQWKAMLGYTEYEIGNRLEEWSNRIHPDDLPEVWVRLDKHLDGQTESYKSEHRIQCKDGTYKWFQDEGKVVKRDNEGEALRLIGTNKDISARKQVEEMLKESEGRYRLLFENMEEGFSLHEIITNEDGVAVDFRFLEANAAYARHTGMEISQCIGNTMLEILPTADRWLIEKYGKVALTGEPLTLDYYSSTFNRYMRVRAFSPQPRRFATIFEDITHRHVAEVELHKISQTVEQSPVMTYVTDLNGLIEYVNPKVIELTGYSRAELIGQTPHIFNSGELSNEEYETLWKTIKSGKEWKGEFHNKKKNGDLFWVLASLSPIFDHNGMITHFVAIEEDITQSKVDYEALQIANLRFKSLISSMQAGVMVEDQQRKVVLVNQYFCDLFLIPVPPEQLIGMNCEAAAEGSKVLFTNPDSFIRDINKTLEIRQVITNHELQMKNGISLERDFIPIGDSEDKNQGILWIYRDITTRKNVEKDLLRQSEILSGTAKAMNYLLTIPDHHQAMQKALEAVGVATGVDRSYIFEAKIDKSTGETFLDQQFEWTAEGVLPEIGNSELQNLPFSREYPRWFNMLSNGQTLSGLVKDFPAKERQFLEPQDIISLIVVPVFVNDVFWGTVGFDDCSKGIPWSNNEVSILKALAASIGGSISREIIGKELTNAKQIAEKATKTKSDFLATMSHEIRTPMNGVIGMTSLLMQTQLTPDQLDYAETIKISGELLLDLINEILDFAKIESGKMVLEEHPFDLRMAIEDAIDLTAPAAVKKNLGLYFQIDPSIPQMIKGDLTRLRQILVNLTGNAIKFTDAGEVVISVKQTGIQDNVAFLEFSVKDTGIGIAPEKIDRLFKPFSQVDTSTTRKYGGSGLGLAICWNLVKLMNGTIRVVSKVNHGSEFIFTIKTSFSSEDRETTKIIPDRERLKGKKILIVDGHPTINSILFSLFKDFEMEPIAANSAEMSLMLLNESSDFDLALIDNDLPDLDGITLISKIIKINEVKNIPLILMTNPHFIGNGVEMDSRFQVRINKPLKQSQLISHVTNLLYWNKSARIQNSFQSKLFKKTSEMYPLKILVAEDNAINQKLIFRLFEMLGYSIHIAANGYEVIDILNRMRIDIVFMDIQMPEMDGFEATKQIISQWGDKKPLIVAMTANALVSDKERCLAAGMDDYISKPLTIEQIKNGLDKWALNLNIAKINL